jgi:hypothetical protein
MNTEIERLSTDFATRAAGILVTDQASANRATELILAGKGMIRKIKDFYEIRKAKAHELWKFECDEEKAELAKVEPIVNKLNQGVSNWRAEEARKYLAAEAERARIENERRRIEEETLQRAREAEEKAEYERKRLEEEAERLEKLRQEAAKNADNEITLKRIEEQKEKLRLQAIEAKRIADAETTVAIDEGAAAESALPPAPAIQETPKTAGLAIRRYWKARVTNLSILIHSITNGLISIEAISPCTAYLNDLAGRLKDQVKIPGVEFYAEEKMAEIGKRNKV